VSLLEWVDRVVALFGLPVGDCIVLVVSIEFGIVMVQIWFHWLYGHGHAAKTSCSGMRMLGRSRTAGATITRLTPILP
jgi:hypothetical protein